MAENTKDEVILITDAAYSSWPELHHGRKGWQNTLQKAETLGKETLSKSSKHIIKRKENRANGQIIGYFFPERIKSQLKIFHKHKNPLVS